jgi:S1-C subfamily serine protease
LGLAGAPSRGHAFLMEPRIPPEAQPKQENCAFDLERALGAVVRIQSTIPEDAFTASVLGTERSGHGVLIQDDGLILTVGYLIVEAATIWIGFDDGSIVPGHIVAYDHETGFGLVQALGRVRKVPLPVGRSLDVPVGANVVVAASGGHDQSLEARLVAQQPFAGYWEYSLDRALFTVPAHPSWGGAALVGPEGDLIGIGSLRLEAGAKETIAVNMFVPIELLPPILPDLLAYGKPNRPARPWLGLYATELGEEIIVAGIAEGTPAHRAGVQPGDRLVRVGGEPVGTLGELWKAVWACGDAGAKVVLGVSRDDITVDVTVRSADRSDFLKKPVAH